MIRKIFLSTISAMLLACSPSGGEQSAKETLFVSIAPLKYITEQIADTTFDIRVLVPETTSPETYEPTVQQIGALAKTRAYISTGLIDFEKELSGKIASVAPQTQYIDLSQGMQGLVGGTCSHDHGHSEHNHAEDPHIWLSVGKVREMAAKIAEQLALINPQQREQYQQNYRNFAARLDHLDSTIAQTLAQGNVHSFAIAHPSLTYYAMDYGLDQIAIETEGKEPSVQAMKQIIDTLRARKISKVFYQRQTNGASAERIAHEVGASTVEFDPLAEDWQANLLYITDQLSKP